jgi:hypothetical protein
VVVDSFSREIIEQTMSDFLGEGGFNRYLAKLKGVAAGGARMRIVASAESLMLPRRVHKLLSSRPPEALDHSASAMRYGFSLLYSRAIPVLDLTHGDESRRAQKPTGATPLDLYAQIGHDNAQYGHAY